MAQKGWGVCARQGKQSMKRAGWEGRCLQRGRDGQGEGWMKGKCAMFVCPTRRSPSPRPHVCGRGWILPRDNNKKRSRAWKSLELFSAHKLPLFVTACFISGEGWGDGIWRGALMVRVCRSMPCSWTKNTIFQISPLFHSMELISSHPGNSIHHEIKVKSEGQLSSKGWENQMLSELTPCSSPPSHHRVPQPQGSPTAPGISHSIPETLSHGRKEFKQLFSCPRSRSSSPGTDTQHDPCQFVLGTQQGLGKVGLGGVGKWEVLGFVFALI